MTRRPPRLAVALLEHIVPDNGPLTGDLLEAWSGRTNAWLWRQVLSAFCTCAILPIRTNPWGSAAATLVAVGIVTLLAFCAVVAASLLNLVFVSGDAEPLPAPSPGGRWAFLFWTLAFAAAVVVGRTVRRFHERHRLAVILACAASATVAAFANLVLFVQTPPHQPFFPSALSQLAVMMLFIIGLFTGILSRSACEPLSSS